MFFGIFVAFFLHSVYADTTTTTTTNTDDPINTQAESNQVRFTRTSSPTTTTVFDPHAGHNHPTWIPPSTTDTDTSTAAATGTTETLEASASTVPVTATATTHAGSTTLTESTVNNVATRNDGMRLSGFWKSSKALSLILLFFF